MVRRLTNFPGDGHHTSVLIEAGTWQQAHTQPVSAQYQYAFRLAPVLSTPIPLGAIIQKVDTAFFHRGRSVYIMQHTAVIYGSVTLCSVSRRDTQTIEYGATQTKQLRISLGCKILRAAVICGRRIGYGSAIARDSKGIIARAIRSAMYFV
jgi:hypothetical protein